MTTWNTIRIDREGAVRAQILFAGDAGVVGPAAYRSRAADAIRSAGFDGCAGRWLDVLGDGGQLPRLLVIGLKGDGGATDWRAAGRDIQESLTQLQLASAQLPAAADLGGDDKLRDILAGALLCSFALDQGRSKPTPGFRPERLVVDPADASVIEEVQQGVRPINRARAWVEQPANVLTPDCFAREAAAALEALGVRTRVLDREQLEALGAGAILAVSSASEHPPQLLVAEWRGDPSRPAWDVALVGKGLTFDSGGLNVKTAPVIEKMKFDMAGAAAVIGALELAASRRTSLNIVAIVPMVENVVGGAGFRPGDVVRSLSGRTIEIVNTDAEGRLVLADAITYSVDHYAPACVVDVATLTGTMAALFYEEFAGFYASDDELAAGLLRSSERTDELLWRMPLSRRHDYVVESTVADLSNLGAKGYLANGGGSPTAGAKFLEPFAEGTRWAHIDMAGPAWCSRPTRRSRAGASGFGVRLLDDWLSELSSRAR